MLRTHWVSNTNLLTILCWKCVQLEWEEYFVVRLVMLLLVLSFLPCMICDLVGPSESWL